jgi:hypothetical protein
MALFLAPAQGKLLPPRRARLRCRRAGARRAQAARANLHPPSRPPRPAPSPLSPCLKVRLAVHSRRARLVFVPAFHLLYTWGSRYTPSRADIVPEQHEALLSGR